MEKFCETVMFADDTACNKKKKLKLITTGSRHFYSLQHGQAVLLKTTLSSMKVKAPNLFLQKILTNIKCYQN